MSTFSSSLGTFAIGVVLGAVAVLFIRPIYLDGDGGSDCSDATMDCISKTDAVSYSDSDPGSLIKAYSEWADTSKISDVKALNIPKDVINSMYLFVNYPPSSTVGIEGIRIYYGSTTPITGRPNYGDTRMILWPMHSGGDTIASFPSDKLRILKVPSKFELPCPQYCD